MNILDRISSLEGPRAPRAEEIARRIEALIAEAGLEVGAPLGKKEELRGRFKVSPGTMNEAVRIMESRGIITMKRGSKGGIFVATTSVHISLRQSIAALVSSTALVEECRAVYQQLKPLVLIEAAKSVSDDAVADLRRLLGAVAASSDTPIESHRSSWLFERRVAEMVSNTVLRTLYLTLLNLLEHESEGTAAPVTHFSPEQEIANLRRIVDAIASRDLKRAASAAG